MSHITIPAGYRPALGLYDTQKAIGLIKRLFEDCLCGTLELQRVTAPLFLQADTGLNDDLNGVERAVSFDIPDAGTTAQVVHSLAKWKRQALAEYGFAAGRGLYTDMNAIRRDETLDNLHSIYVDQWDWEKIITPDQRNADYLKLVVQGIVDAICDTQKTLQAIYPALCAIPAVQRRVTFITTQQLEDLYPDLTPKQREQAITKEHGTVFLAQIGGVLAGGKPHDGRAPDYDDWTLNGDILCWHSTLGCALELSSMGIRVDPAAMDRQLTAAGCDARRTLPFHSALLAGKLPQTIGGGIGQSRLCMLLLGSAHIGEVQSGVWDAATLAAAKEAGIPIL